MSRARAVLSGGGEWSGAGWDTGRRAEQDLPCTVPPVANPLGSFLCRPYPWIGVLEPSGEQWFTEHMFMTVSCCVAEVLHNLEPEPTHLPLGVCIDHLTKVRPDASLSDTLTLLSFAGDEAREGPPGIGGLRKRLVKFVKPTATTHRRIRIEFHRP